jgi:hypothetical protein
LAQPFDIVDTAALQTREQLLNELRLLLQIAPVRGVAQSFETIAGRHPDEQPVAAMIYADLANFQRYDDGAGVFAFRNGA